MRRFIALSKGERYAHDGVIYCKGVSHEVDEETFLYLRSVGYFKEAFPDNVAPVSDDTLDAIPGFDYLPETNVPQNSLGFDNLNGKRILFRRMGALGDALFVIQVAALVKSNYPTAHITLGILERYLDFAKQFTCVDAVITVTESTHYASLQTFDYVVSFNGVIENNVVHDGNYHQAHFIRAGLKWVGNETMPVLLRKQTEPVVTGAEKKISDALQCHGLTPGDFVVILTGTGSGLRTPEHSILHRIARDLNKGAGLPRSYRVLFVSHEDDSFQPEDTNNLNAMQLRISDLCAVTRLLQLSAFVIGADTGLTHTAAAMGVPAVILWTNLRHDIITHAMPYPERIENVQSSIACSPCHRIRPAYCKAYNGDRAACTTQFKHDEIMGAIQRHQTAKDKRLEPVSLSGAPANVISVDEACALIDTSYVNVVMPLRLGETYTGGGHYSWHVARSIAAHRNMRVFVLLDTTNPVYARGASALPERFYAVYDSELSLMFGEQKQQFQFALGQPKDEGLMALRYRNETPGCKSILFVYETPNYIATHRGGADTYEEFWAEYKKALQETDAAFIISRTTRRNLIAWIPQIKMRMRDYKLVHPVVDNACAESVLLPFQKAKKAPRFHSAHRTNSVVLVSRNVDYKQMERTVQFIAERFAPYKSSTQNPFFIHVIGIKTQQIARFGQRANYAARAINVVAHESCPEDKKWRLLSQARALIHPSEFEGFGIPVAEGLYAGTPVLAHPLRVFQSSFEDFPFYYITDDQLLFTLHHLWKAWDAPDTGAVSYGKQKLMALLYEGFRFVAARYTTAARESRLNTIFERDFKDQKIAERNRAFGGPVDNVLRIAHIADFSEPDVARVCNRILDNINCSHKIFATLEPYAREPQNETPRIERCFQAPLSTFYEGLRQRIIDFAPDVVHIHYSDGLTAQVSTLKRSGLHLLMDSLRKIHLPMCVSLYSAYTGAAVWQGVHSMADVTTLPRALQDASSAIVLPFPCESYPLLEREVAKERCALQGKGFVIGLFVESDFAALETAITSYSEIVAAVSSKVTLALSFQDEKQEREFTEKYQDSITAGKFVLLQRAKETGDLIAAMCACDCVVLIDHGNVERHDTSSMVRVAFASQRPVVCPETPRYAELSHERNVIKYAPDSVPAFAGAVASVLKDAKLQAVLLSHVKQYLLENSTGAYMKRLYRIYRDAAALKKQR